MGVSKSRLDMTEQLSTAPHNSVKQLSFKAKINALKNVYVLLLDLYNLKTSKIKGIINLKPLANSTLV